MKIPTNKVVGTNKTFTNIVKIYYYNIVNL